MEVSQSAQAAEKPVGYVDSTIRVGHVNGHSFRYEWDQFGGDPFISTPDVGQALFIKDEKNWGDYVRLAKIDPQ